METYREKRTAFPSENILEPFQQLLLSETMQQFSRVAPDGDDTWEQPEHSMQGEMIIVYRLAMLSSAN